MAGWDVWSKDFRSGQWMVVDEAGVSQEIAEREANRRNKAAADRGITDALYQAVERGSLPLNDLAVSPVPIEPEPLAVGSVVLTRDVVYIRNHPTPVEQWRGTDGSNVTDGFIANEIRVNGGDVARVGRF